VRVFSPLFVVPPLPGIAETGSGRESALPVSKMTNGVQFVSSHTVAKLLSRELAVDKDFYIIDCRFEYEFDGGHIANAINLRTDEQVEKRFITNRPRSNSGGTGSRSPILIFHCEFSSHRGPNL
jgi:hypothetical protein